MKKVIFTIVVLMIFSGCQEEFEKKIEMSETATQVSEISVLSQTQTQELAQSVNGTSKAPTFLGLPELPH